jgi:hemoglobin
MRHSPFIIGPAERDAWLRHMNDALRELQAEARISDEDADELRAYLDMAANTLVNTA